MAMYTKNAEFKAGVVVILALGTLFALLWLAGEAESWFAPRREIHLRFEQGFAAPKEGDAVYMNGVKIGTVKRVEQRQEIRRGDGLTPADRAALKLRPGEDGVAREIFVLATLRLPKEQPIPDGTTAQIEVNLTGGRELRLKPGLLPRDLSDEDTRRQPILATAAGNIADISRSLEELVSKASTVLEAGNAVLGEVQAAVGEVRRKVETIDVTGIQANVLAATSDLRRALDVLPARVNEIAAKVIEAVDDFKRTAAGASDLLKAIEEDMKRFATTLREAATDLKGIVVRAGPKVDAVLDEFAATAKAVSAAAEGFTGIGPRVKAIVEEGGLDVDEALAKFSQTAHNLADASEDLRANPWKLTTKPDEKEIAFENLKYATQNWVRAAEAVQRTAQRLQALEARTDLSDADLRAQVQKTLDALRADQAKHDDAFRHLHALLQAGGGPPARQR